MVGNRLLVLAGPTAVGKGTVARYIVEHNPDVQLSVSATTRSARPGEVDGVHYYFLTDPEFDALIADGQMLEYAVVHGSHRYGTPKAPVEAALADGKNVLLEIDIQGARQVKQALPEAITVFLAPPSWDELVRRLEGRGTENAEQQARRLETAREELAAQGEFDHILVNDEVAKCATQVVELLKS
jgi:guanylate kinase